MRVKFISLNLWIGGILFEEILEFLKKEKPDILALQEAYNGKNPNFEKRYRSLHALNNELDFPYQSFSPAVIDVLKFGKVEQGNAILSKFPIVETKTVFYDVSLQERTLAESPGDFSFTPRNLQHAGIETNSAKLNVFNTQGIWGFDGEDSERRLKMGATIMRETRDKKNVILAGDFNLKPYTETVKNIEKNLNNIFKDELISTFNMKRKNNEGYATSVVDMVFVSRNIKVLNHYCPAVDISDHLPLVCIFEI